MSAPAGAGRRGLWWRRGAWAVRCAVTASVAVACSDGAGPDGRARHPGTILFAREAVGESQIWIGNPDHGSPRVLTGGPGFHSQPAWSPDGSRIAYIAAGSAAGVHVMRADGSHDELIVPGVGVDASPSWSPDGRRIVFASTREGNSRLFVVASSGGALRRIETDCSNSRRPAWSPVRSQIAFECDRHSIVLIAPNGSGQQSVAAAEGPSVVGAPAWSPDGGSLVFTLLDPSTGTPTLSASQVYRLRLDGFLLTRLTSLAEGTVLGAAWSPDGRRIVIESFGDRSGGIAYRLFVMRADGSNLRPVFDAAGDEYSPAW